jgi:hypothetical protein
VFTNQLPELLGPRHGIIALCLATILFAGCRREGISVYRVPKEKQSEVTGAQVAQVAEGTQPQLQWKTPPGWQEQTPGGMSVASFLVPGAEGQKALLSVMTFPGEGAGEVDLINIVRENAGLPPVSGDELARLVEQVKIGGEPAKLIDLSGASDSSDNSSSNRILLAVFPHGGVTWFFKLAGDATVVSGQKPVLLDFLNSVSFTEGAAAGSGPARFESENVKRRPGGDPADTPARPAWEVPANWREAPVGEMSLARFEIGGSEGKAEVTVSAFPGPAGGLLANVNRWRGQLGLKPVGQTEAEKLAASLDVMGGKAMLVDMNGQNPETGQKVRLISAIVPREGLTWFYKLKGDEAAAGREKAAFIKFVQSARYPNA